MANKKLVGENYSTPELRAKVTGRAKYAEDYRAEGMLFARLLQYKAFKEAAGVIQSLDAEGAKRWRSRRTLSSSPVRQWPPSSSDQRLSVTWSLPIPAPVQVASGARRLSVST